MIASRTTENTINALSYILATSFASVSMRSTSALVAGFFFSLMYCKYSVSYIQFYFCKDNYFGQVNCFQAKRRNLF